MDPGAQVSCLKIIFIEKQWHVFELLILSTFGENSTVPLDPLHIWHSSAVDLASGWDPMATTVFCSGEFEVVQQLVSYGTDERCLIRAKLCPELDGDFTFLNICGTSTVFYSVVNLFLKIKVYTLKHTSIPMCVRSVVYAILFLSELSFYRCRHFASTVCFYVVLVMLMIINNCINS